MIPRLGQKLPSKQKNTNPIVLLMVHNFVAVTSIYAKKCYSLHHADMLNCTVQRCFAAAQYFISNSIKPHC